MKEWPARNVWWQSIPVQLGAVLLIGIASAATSYFIESLLLADPLQRVVQVPYRIPNIAILPLRIIFMKVVTGIGPIHPMMVAGMASAFFTPILLWGLAQAWGCYQNSRTVSQLQGPLHAGRRQFLVKGAVAAAGAGVAGLGLYSSLRAPQAVALMPYSIPVDDLPPEFRGLRIAHISDTHFGPYISLDYLDHVVDLVNAEEPDLVVLTGDYVHRTPNAIYDGIGIFKRLQPRLGTVGVLGNHDHWEGAAQCRARFSQLRIPLVDNTRLFLNKRGLAKEPDPGAICVGGVGDLWAGEVKPDAALGGLPAAMPRLLLSHNPDVAETELAKAGRVDLMFSGHTHGGQVSVPGWGPPLLPSNFGMKYEGGLVTGPHCRVLISRGLGMAMIPVRFGVPPEIPIITLDA